MNFRFICFLWIIFFATSVCAQPDSSKQTVPKEIKWYDTFNVRGYVQARYNRLLETNSALKNEQGDKTIGESGGFSLRRVRVIFSGQLSRQVYFYVQPDFASTSGNKLNFGQLRDAYFDIGVDKKNEFRFRIGQSKIPFGFENMQSSQNRLPLDRADATNSAFNNERDAGVFFYWAPEKIRQRFAMLVKEGLKGSGDYGVFGFGLFNGQTANTPDANNQPHWVARLSYPFMVGSQIIEGSLQGYSGKYVVTADQVSNGIPPEGNYADERIAASFILYPRPFGIQAEYNRGRGPAYNLSASAIEVHNLDGAYITLSYLTRFSKQVLIPFSRLQYYNGGKKHELDARKYNVKELEIGMEWQPVKNFELVTQYTISSRNLSDHTKPANNQRGNLLRIQAQVNF